MGRTALLALVTALAGCANHTSLASTDVRDAMVRIVARELVKDATCRSPSCSQLAPIVTRIEDGWCLKRTLRSDDGELDVRFWHITNTNPAIIAATAGCVTTTR